MNKHILAFMVGAITMATTLVACDRGDTQDASGSSQPEERVAQRAPAQPATQAPAPSSSPLPPREALADTVITGKIKSAILGDPAMQGADVSVNTDRGVVTLAGLVKTPEQTAIASAHAQRQDGVMRVDNHLSPARQ